MNPIQAQFDPLTGLPVKKGPPPINTRTMLYHESRPPIVVEGKGATDAEKREDVAALIKAKQRDGYTLQRPHGQHPHSFDDHRMDHQRRAAANGDRLASEALEAKSQLAKAKEVAAPVSEVAALRRKLDDLQAQLESLTAPSI